MENLIKKLQEEAGLTKEQAIKTLSIVKEYMDKEGLDIDWEKFFKGKYEDLVSNVKSLYDNYSHQAEEYSNKLADKVEDLAGQAKKAAKEFTDKASDILKKD